MKSAAVPRGRGDGVVGTEVVGDDAGGEDENSTPSIMLGWFEADMVEDNIFDDITLMLASRAHRCHRSKNVGHNGGNPSKLRCAIHSYDRKV